MTAKYLFLVTGTVSVDQVYYNYEKKIINSWFRFLDYKLEIL